MRCEACELRVTRECIDAIDDSGATFGRLSAQQKSGAKYSAALIDSICVRTVGSTNQLRLARVNRLLQSRLRLHADEPVHHFAVLENHERGNAAHAVALSSMRGVVDV